MHSNRPERTIYRQEPLEQCKTFFVKRNILTVVFLYILETINFITNSTLTLRLHPYNTCNINKVSTHKNMDFKNSVIPYNTQVSTFLTFYQEKLRKSQKQTLSTENLSSPHR